MKKLILLMCLLLIPAGAQAQAQGASSPSEMKKLDFLIGNWSGEGWIEMGPGGRKTFMQTESVQSKLNGTVTIIEGLGKSKQPDTGQEVVVHNALAVISFDAVANKFQFRAFRADGKAIDADFIASEKSLVWGFREPQRNFEIKYTIKLNEAGQWFEVGEFSMDGKNWRKFFEMTLQRVK